MAEHRSNRGWIKGLAIWVLALLLLGAAGCAVFWRYLSVYEETLPEKVMNAVMERMTEADWRDALRATSGAVSRYEDTAALFNGYFDSTVKGKPMTYRSDLQETGEQQSVYNIYAGTARIAAVRLVPDTERGAAGFHRFHWKLDSITSVPLSEQLRSVVVQIDAPPGFEVYLNGVRPSAREIADDAVPLADVSPLEARFTERATLVRYATPPLYGQISVTDGEGRPIQRDGTAEDGVVRFTVLPKETYSFLAEAPEDVAVTVCGAELTGSERVSRDERLFRKLEGYVGEDGYATCRYAADGLYTVPDIRAEYRGQELTPVVGSDGCFHFFYPSDPETTEQMRLAAEEFFTAYMAYLSSRFNTAAYQRLLARLLPGTELDAYVKNSMAAMIWASATEMSDAKLSFDNFHIVSEDCFTCTIQYSADFTAASWYEKYSYERKDGYCMVFIRQGEQWKAAAMSAFAA